MTTMKGDEDAANKLDNEDEAEENEELIRDAERRTTTNRTTKTTGG